MSKFQKVWRLVTIAALLASALNLSFLSATPVQALSTDIVISQVYGGGGGSSGTYIYDYVELFNLGVTAVNIGGWSVQYGSATGNFGSTGANIYTFPTGTIIQPGKYLFVQLGSAGTGGAAFPVTPDIITTNLSMGATSGKVALANISTALGCGATATLCTLPDSRIVDSVSYGTANNGEGGTTVNNGVAITNQQGGGRKVAGCQETDNNNADFDVLTGATLLMRSSASPVNPCGPVPPTLSINDVSLSEGDSATTTFTFTVSLSAPAPAGGVTFDIGTTDGTATAADGDYTIKSLTSQSIAAGNTTFSFDVLVNGDITSEANETFTVDVTNVTGATLGDGQGLGTILNDDVPLPSLTISDATITEGNSSTTTASFTVSLDIPAGAGGVSFDIATNDGTATVADNDYTAKSLTSQSIASGQQVYTFDVLVNGDTKDESNEIFNVNITNLTGAALTDGQGLGTITNDDATPTYVIQGSGSATPISGSVTTSGIVVGDYEGGISPEMRGFYIQDSMGDGNPATSDGLFVFNGSNNDVALGDLVRVTGTVAEYQDQTQISATSIVILSNGNTIIPANITLPFASAAEQEQYEGMLVNVPQTLYVTEIYQLGRFGQVTMSGTGRLYQPTNVVDPGTPALALQAANNLNKIIVDDADNSQNSDPILFGLGGNPLSASNTLRGGDTLNGLVGVFTYTWGGNLSSPSAYRIRPINAMGGGIPNFVTANARPATPPVVGGSIKAVGMNTLNYFNTFGIGACTNGVGGTITDCRGANDATEFTRQSAKIVNAIIAINADAIGIMEVENDGYGAGSAIQDLVGKLNAIAGAGTYAFINPDTTNGINSLGTDAIKVGIIYKPAVLTPVGITTTLNTVAFINAGDSAPRNRASLLQAFETASNERFLFNVNHLKSKGSACNDPDAGDGQGECNIVRTNAVNELLNWLGTDPTGTGDADILIVGDMNSYAKEDPIKAFETAGYINMVNSFGGANAYSYVFDGQWGYLDYAIASPSLFAQTTDTGEWHINADEPVVLDYNTEFKSVGQISSLYSPDPFRTSDHDPVLVGLNLTANGPDTQIDSHPPVLSASPSADFTFSSPDLTASFECNLDTVIFTACVSPVNYSGLNSGAHNFQVRAKDTFGNVDITPASFSWTIDLDAPSVSSSVLLNSNPTSAASVGFTVTFSELVTGVDLTAPFNDFSINQIGVTGAAVSGVSVSGNVYTVTVSTGSGNGTLRLDVPASATITDLAGNSLTGVPYTSGEFYTVNKTAITLPSPWIGGISISSDKNVVSVGRPHIGSEIASYDGFSAGALTAYVPMLFKNAYGGTYDSALYIQNVDATLATLSIKYYTSAGALTCTVSGETIAPLASKGYWLPGLAASCLPDGWVGGAVITSDKNIVANGRPHIGAEVMTYDSISAGSLTSYLPMLFKNAYGGSYDSAFYVQNVGAATANLTIKYYDSAGSLTCTVNGETVAPFASKGYWLPGLAASCLPDGWVGGVVVTSTQPIVTVGRPHVGTQITTYNGFSAGAGTSYVPMLFKNAYGGSYDAAFYVQNVGASAATLSIKYYDLAGNLTCTVPDTVAPLASKGYWLPGLPTTCLPDGWIGGAVVTSNVDVVAIGRPHVGAQVTTYDGFTSGSLNSYLPMLFKDAYGGSYDAAYYIQNTEASAANVLTKFYDSTGALTCTRSDTLAPFSTLSLWLPSLTCVP